MKRQTYAEALDAQVQKHSQLQKPYRVDDYQAMEYAFPMPLAFFRFEMPEIDWPSVQWSTVETVGFDEAGSPWVPGPGERWLVLGCRVECVIEKTSGMCRDHGGEDNDCASEYCLKFAHLRTPIKAARITKGSGTITTLTEDSVCFDIDAGSATSSVFGSELFEVEVTVEAPPGLGPAYERTCIGSIYVSCCDCDADDYSFEWDSDNSATTIDQDDMVSVYVTGGCPPYKWEVTGTGFIMGTRETTGTYNTLIADASACGPASITVTDDCGNSVTGGVRSTEGRWDTTYSRALGGCDDDGMGTRYFYFSQICRLNYLCGAEGEGSSYCAPMEGVCAEFDGTVCFRSDLCSVCRADSQNWKC